MLTVTVDANKVLGSIDAISEELIHLTSSLDEKEVNTVPYKDSWTAAQLLDHVTKSTKSIAQALNMPSKKVDRDPGEKIQELKDTFLDYSKKMKSPEFILPTKNVYDKTQLIDEYKKAILAVEKAAKEVVLSEAISHHAFGEVTKYELLYFVEVHTQRHTHQQKKIIKALVEKT